MSSPRKFRVWDGEEMHEPPHDYILTGMRGVWKVKPGPSTTHEVLKCDDNVSALFSTGLIDAEANEIWEGDVVEDKYGNTGVVKWAEGGSCWKMAIYRAANQTTAEQKLTVIGNRYEDPSLSELEAHTP